MKKTLFLASLLCLSPCSFAAVGDTVDFQNMASGGFIAEGVGGYFSYGYYYSDIKNSTRFYDSTKGWAFSGNSEGDSRMCWAHTASNMIQYWQSYYGVFYKGSKELPYGSDYTRTIQNVFNPANDYTITDPMRLNVAKECINSGFLNQGDKVSTGTDWFFTWTDANAKGGYYSEYFGAYSYPNQPETAIATSVYTQAELTPTLLSALGITKQGDGTYKQTEAGLIAHLNVGTGDSSNFSAHTLTCYGVTLDSTGNIKAIIYADSDNNKLIGTEGANAIAPAGYFQPSLETAYVKEENGKIMLYTDMACTQALTYDTENHYYLEGITQIKTPEVLKKMLAEYSDTQNEAQVWNGGSTTWSTQTADINELPTESTGWDVYVNGADIAAEHQDYYHTYAIDGRDVEFGSHAAEGNRTVTINGTVAANNITVSAAGYEFVAGTNAKIDGAGMLRLTDGASLSTELDLGERAAIIGNGATLTGKGLTQMRFSNLTLEGNATLGTTTDAVITVTGNFQTVASGSASYALMRSIVPEASINADLDLTNADSISIENIVNMNQHDLYLSSTTPLTISLTATGDIIPIFTNIGDLYLDGVSVALGTDMSELVNFTNFDTFANYSLIYSDHALSLIVPEPSTISLSLLALASLVIRRRR